MKKRPIQSVTIHHVISIIINIIILEENLMSLFIIHRMVTFGENSKGFRL